jgi:transcription-repair coupling factor (superfamily II helicase)
MIDVLKKRIYSTSTFENSEVPKDPSSPIFIDGLKGSLRTFFITYLVEILQKPVIFLTSDQDSAEKIRDDLEILFKEQHVVFFPSYERVPYDDHEPNPSLLKLRLETLQHLVESGQGVIVSTVEGLMSRVPLPEKFVDHQYYIKVNSTYIFDEFLMNLQNAGYTREEIVEDVGQFTVRGGIIDIFPWTSSDPVRVEFFGDQIDSIRTFNVISQRSIDTINGVELLPNLDNDENTGSLFDFFSDEALLIIEDRGIFNDRVQSYEDQINASYRKLLSEDVYPEKPANRYLDKKTLNNSLAKFPSFYTGLLSEKDFKKHQFESTTPPTFAGHLNRLFSYLEKSRKSGLLTIIQCDSKTQAERISEILEDEKLEDAAEVSVGALHNGFVLPEAGLQVLTDHEIFDRFKKRRTYPKFKNGEYLRSLSSLNLYDYIVHIQYGIGQYLGLQTIESGDNKRECIKLAYAEDDVLFVSVDRLNNVQKYASEEESLPKLTRLGTGEWERIKKKTQESIEKIAGDLLNLQAERKVQKGFAFSKDTHWQLELEASFPFEETEDQLAAIGVVKRDLENDIPMDRLLCGDVGYGKTEVALRAAFKIVMDGKQVAILVPTTILAYQHYQTFRERMSEFPVNVEMLSRFRSAKEQKRVINKLEEGEADIVIGTHRLLSDDVKMKDMGLLIIDEEQRFGVKHKEKLKNIRVTVDVLTMTATPIPRTLHLSLMGARDLSHIETPPRNRLPVITEIHEWDDDLIYQAITREMERNGQIYFVHNKVKTIDGIKRIVHEIAPTARVVIAHGQLPERELEKIMLDFIHKKYDVLISTMIIENGLDIPNVNTIIIDHADKFGLAQLYQLRGRVGRSDAQAYAYLLVPHASRLTDLAQKRLRAIQDFADLGSGFKVALRDMEIRGIGNILGKEQSGNLQAVGFDLYCRLVDESVHKLKQDIEGEETNEELKRLSDAQIDVDFDLMIPKDYIANETERVSIYHRLVNFRNPKDLSGIEDELKDRFGPIPKAVTRIIDAIELKILAGKLLASHIRLNKKNLILKFPDDLKDVKEFHEKIFPGLMNFKQTEVIFTGDQESPHVQFILKSESKDDLIVESKNILQNII